MGYAITWCAVREEGAEQFLRSLRLYPTGATEQRPDSLISTARLDTGWRLLWYNKCGCPFLRPSDLRGLSRDVDVLLCLVEEHVMASSAEMWSGGTRRWWLSHQGDEAPRGLAMDGELPQTVPAIREKMESAQLADGGDDADVDYFFQIPLLTAQSIVGFMHDETCPHLIGRFVVMSRET